MELQFNVRREGRTVIISVRPFYNVNLHLPLRFECRDEMDAEAYYRLIRDGMWERIRAIRANSYERGYSDGRAKRAKRTYHAQCVNTVEQT